MLVSGCASNPFPPFAELRDAAQVAATARETWIPLALAGAVAVSASDRQISDWARERTPIFGGNTAAADASNVLLLATHGAMLGTALAASEPQRPDSKTTRVLSHYTALGTTLAGTGILKSVVARRRPDQSDNESMPSGHTALGYTNIRFAQTNLEQIMSSNTHRAALNTALEVGAAATGWARIEAGVHHPTDVLAGAALGSFVAAVTTEILTKQGYAGSIVSSSCTNDFAALTLRFDF